MHRLVSTSPVVLLAALLAAAAPAFAQAGPATGVPVVPILGDPPPAPSPGKVPPPEFAVEAIPAQGLAIDTQDREAVRVFYRGLFTQSDGVAMDWTGSYASGDAGATSQLYQNAVALRINWYRALAGIPANVSLYEPYSAKDQQAALMMSVRGQLSHFPSADWTYYSAGGAEAAANSNLALGHAGPEAVTGYIVDSGTNNAAAGHRRWLLYPQTTQMGSGDVPGGPFGAATVSAANALWVFDSNFGGPRPAVRDDFVAWPPRGYVPYQAVVGRWSFSYPGAEFSNATVTMSPGGPAAVESTAAGFGENTIVWLPQGFTGSTAWPRPAADQAVTVTLDNVLVGGVPRSFSYQVVIFDSDVPTPGAPLSAVLAPAAATAQVPFAVSVPEMAGASAYQVRLYRTSALGAALTPANSGGAWTANVSSGYTAIGSSEFRLMHTDSKPQILSLAKALHAGAGASMSFTSRLGVASASELAKVQVSLDGGASWQDVFSQAGNDAENPPLVRTVSLAAYAGRVIQVRFAFFASGTFYNCCTTAGWFFTDVTFANTVELTLDNWATLPPGTLGQNLVASAGGDYLLAARTEYQGSYFGEWGSGVALPVAPAGSQHALQVALSGAGAVASSPAGIQCGPTCAAGFPANTVIALTATPDPGYSFLGWSGACTGIGACYATMNAAKSVTASFGSGNVAPVAQGFNLMGNASDTPLDVLAVFGTLDNPVEGISAQVDALWSWNAATGKWRFHSPQLSAAQSASYAVANGYEVLSAVPPGEGYWVNAYAPMTLPQPAGGAYAHSALAFAARPPGFNLLAAGAGLTPAQFLAGLGAQDAVNAVWAWDAWRATWYFHSPLLEQPGAPFSNAQYCALNGYQDFAGSPPAYPSFKLEQAFGFWVEKL